MSKSKKGMIIRNYMLIAVIQAQDADNAEDSLCGEGFSVTRLPSVGAFLGRKNVTLLIGLAKEQREMALSILKKKCRQRVEYIAVPLESAPLPMPTPTPITIGGATVFGVEIDQFEEV